MDETSQEKVPPSPVGPRATASPGGGGDAASPFPRREGGRGVRPYGENERVGGDGWSPRVEGEEGDPTAFDFAFGGVIVIVVAAGLLWATGVIPYW